MDKNFRSSIVFISVLVIGIFIGNKFLFYSPSLQDFNKIIQLTVENEIYPKDPATIYLNTGRSGEYKIPNIEGKNIQFLDEEGLKEKIEKRESFMYLKFNMWFPTFYSGRNDLVRLKYEGGIKMTSNQHMYYFIRNIFGQWVLRGAFTLLT